MGDVLPEVIILLTRARNQLLSESQQAASQGKWERAKALMELAERTDRLREEVSANAAEGPPEPESSDLEELPAIEEGSLTQIPPGRGRYPKYRVRDDVLVKQGLQRSGKDVYEHAVPRERFDEIVGLLADMATAATRGRQRSFSIDHVQQQMNCPRYMTYVVVSFLMQAGLVVRARKGTYNFADPAAFRAAAAALWERLKGADAL